MTKTTNTMPAEIEDYFAYLSDPKSLLPVDEIDRVTAALDDESLSAFQKMSLEFDLINLNAVDDSKLVAGFLKAAPKYLASRDIDMATGVEVFGKYGVPDDVLQKLTIIPVKSKGGRLSVDDVVATVKQMRGTFTKQDVIDLTGASPGTTLKALKQCVADGTSTDQGGNPKKLQSTK